MAIGTSLLLIVIGAVLAVVIDLGTIGGILIAIGVLGLILSLAYAASQAPPGTQDEVESRLNEIRSRHRDHI